MPGVGADTADVTYHDAAWYGSWAAVWHYIRAWTTPLRGRQIARVGPGGGFAYQRSVTTSWDRIARAHTLVRASDMGLLPPGVSFPDIRSVLVDGRVSPATVPLGQGGGGDDADPDEPLVLPGLDSCDSACHPHAQRAASAVVASLEFLSLHVSSTPQGRARLMDGSVPRGPFLLLLAPCPCRLLPLAWPPPHHGL